MTIRTVTATISTDGVVTYEVPTLRNLPDGVTSDMAQDAVDAAVELADYALEDDGQVSGESVTVRVFFTDAERRAAADLSQ